MSVLLPHLRLLPLTALLAAALLVVKAGALWQTVMPGLSAGTAFIADASAATRPPAASAATTTPPPTPATAPEATAKTPAPAAAIAVPPKLTRSEIEVLQQLAERRQALDARTEELNHRETLLQASEMRIDQKLSQLKELQTTLERLITAYDAQQNEQIKSLIKIYENMKPKDAARIFEELKMNTLLPVADLMKERKLAAILAEMNPARAKDITEELAQLRSLPTGAEARDGRSGS
jgi:flagellar motility protein MotE (MotC chaperone)